jgi:protein gp37
MGATTKIKWADATFNPWIGCQEVSAACDHCYARVQNEHRKWVKGWGPHGERRLTAASTWRQPVTWDRKAAREGRRLRVFCASLADVFDNQVPDEPRSELWRLIRGTPNLDWMLLTKRPQNIAGMLPADWNDGWPNVWLGTTGENQAEADRRAYHLLQVPARLHYLSYEPALGALDLTGWLGGWQVRPGMVNKLNWVICGGESGPGHRAMQPDWARQVRDQCGAAGAAFFFKQWGGRTPDAGGDELDGERWQQLPVCDRE